MTQRSIHDEEALMHIGPKLNWVCDAYEKITALSPSEVYTKSLDKKGEKRMTYYLPTLAGLRTWMDLQNWNLAPLTRREFFELILPYHQAIRSGIMQ